MAVDRSPGVTLTLYAVLTLAFSWSMWGLWATLAGGTAALGPVLFVLGGLGPFAAATVLKWRSRASIRSWLGLVFRPAGRRRYYVIALVLPVVVLLVAGSVHLVVFGGEWTPSTVPAAIEYPLYLGFVLLLGGGLEEPGWRGYLLPELQETYSSLTAALLVGIVWAVWHLPLLVVPGAPQYGLPVVPYLVQLLALSIVLAWISIGVRGSVLPAMVLHAGGNAIINYYPIGGVAGATSTTGLGLFAATVTAVSLVLIFRDGRELDPEGRLKPG